jgi:hypothetical protein
MERGEVVVNSRGLVCIVGALISQDGDGCLCFWMMVLFRIRLWMSWKRHVGVDLRNVDEASLGRIETSITSRSTSNRSTLKLCFWGSHELNINLPLFQSQTNQVPCNCKYLYIGLL